MEQPTLVILAAGMGSRFGGLKQITAVDDFGHSIIDFSLYDAYKAGFRKVAFIIKHEIEDDFKKAVGTRMEKYFEVKYVFQQLDNLPDGYSVPSNRVKPWGTGHAVMCCRSIVGGPFAVINADDFYGRGAFEALYRYLSKEHSSGEYAMVAYEVRNTVTDNGSVARGVCHVKNGLLTDVVEHTKIFKDGCDAKYTEDNGETFVHLPGDTPVSMNCWGFTVDMLDELYNRFPGWLDENMPINAEKCEFFLPFVANEVIREGKGSVSVLPCNEKWYGITYKEDMQGVRDAIRDMHTSGIYPSTMLD